MHPVQGSDDEEAFRRDERVRLVARLMDPTAGIPVPPSPVRIEELIERAEAEEASSRRRWWWPW